MIATLLQDMCVTAEQLRWLVKRAVALYARWPGVPALRQILCSRFEPKDGILITWSESFPDGISAENPPPRLPTALLPPGNAVSADAGLDTAVQQAARHLLRPADLQRDLPPEMQKRAHEFERMLDDVETSPADRVPLPRPLRLRQSEIVRLAYDEEYEPQPQGTYRRITQADIEEAIRKHKAEKAP